MIDEELARTIKTFQRTTVICMATILFCFVFLFADVLYIFPHIIRQQFVSVLMEWSVKPVNE